MASSCFALLKVTDLQKYLSDRGITATNLRRNNLIELCEAVKSLDLPIDPDFTCNTTLDLKKKLVQLPISDPFLDNNFTSDFSEIPSNFTLYDIFNYLLHKTSDYDKKKLRAYKSCEDYRLFIDGHVESLTFNKCGDAEVCLFRAKVKPTQKETTYMSTKFYQLWFSIKKATGEVASAYCTCIGGMDGACRHVSAALYELEDFEMKSVTDGENKWMKRPRSHDCPVPVKRLRIVKAKFSVLNEEKENLLDLYDPRSTEDRNKEINIANFAKNLTQLQADTQALDILEDGSINPTAESKDTDMSCLANSVKEQLKNISMSDHGTPTVSQFRESFGQLAPEIIMDIEQSTRGQTENPAWTAMRYGMLTASNFRKICQAVDKGHCPPSLLKSIMLKYNTSISVPSINWGLKKEKVARELYTRASRCSHKRVCVEEKGLYVMSEYPFIGCSVDGILSCQCHGKRIFEIKCPFSLKHMHPKEVAVQKGCSVVDNMSFVTEKSEYYHQMQGQMGIYGIPHCDLVIYTEKGIHVSQLPFHEAFFRDMIMKMNVFFDRYLFQQLLTDVSNME